jgi:uncharacterized protein
MAYTSAHPHTELAESVRLLIDAGADINGSFNTPDGDDFTVLMCAVECTCCTAVLNVLLQAGADPCARCSRLRETALHRAARLGSVESCELLLTRAGVQLQARDENSWTALMHAAHFGREDNVQLLLQHGADINAVDSLGTTPLITACGQQHVEVVACLLEAGADVDVADNNRYSALIVAAECDSTALMQFDSGSWC